MQILSVCLLCPWGYVIYESGITVLGNRKQIQVFFSSPSDVAEEMLDLHCNLSAHMQSCSHARWAFSGGFDLCFGEDNNQTAKKESLVVQKAVLQHIWHGMRSTADTIKGLFERNRKQHLDNDHFGGKHMRYSLWAPEELKITLWTKNRVTYECIILTCSRATSWEFLSTICLRISQNLKKWIFFWTGWHM